MVTETTMAPRTKVQTNPNQVMVLSSPPMKNEGWAPKRSNGGLKKMRGFFLGIGGHARVSGAIGF